MVATVPIGRRTNLVVAWTHAWGLRWAVWRATCGDIPDTGDDPRGDNGVREPRRPRPPRRCGAVALPRDEPDGMPEHDRAFHLQRAEDTGAVREAGPQSSHR